MDYGDRKWINRRVFYYKDVLFNSGGELTVDISTSTEDGVNFSIPKINLRIKSLDNRMRTFGLDLNETTSLICSLIEAQIQNEVFACSAAKEIIKKGYNQSLVIQPIISNTNENVVIISIVHNESDQGKIVIPFQSFKCICNIFNMFKSDFWKMYTDLQNDYKISNITEIITSLKNSIHILPSLINETEKSDNNIVQDSISNDFNTFLEKTEPEIKIPELDDESKPPEKAYTQEIESKFIEVILKNDIENFYTIMTTISTTNNPLDSFLNSIKDLNISDYTPGLTDSDKKSLLFLSKVAFRTTFKNYLENGKPIDSNFSILRYNGVPDVVENLELAYDLFMIMAYIQTVRERLESKVSDGQVNKSILYASVRCFLDPLIFSFLYNKSPDVVKNCILVRYEYFNQKGFFKSFDKIIEDNLCTKITSSDISLLVNKVCGVLDKTKTIKELHIDSYKSDVLTIPYENEFTEEQIINEIVDLQVDKRLGREILTKDEELKKLFLKKSKKDTKVKIDKAVKRTPKYKNNIHRFVNEVDFIKQIPPKYKGDFLVYIETLEGDYDFSNLDFPVEEFGEDIVKGLYLWNDSENKKEAYTNFRVRHENCLSKENILAKVKNEVEVNKEDEFNFTNFGLSSLNDF